MDNKRVLRRISLLDNLPEQHRFNVRNTAQISKIRKELCELVAAECTSCSHFTFSSGTTKLAETLSAKGQEAMGSDNRPSEHQAAATNKPEIDDDAVFNKLASADLKEDNSKQQCPLALSSAQTLRGNRPKRRQRTTEIGSLENIPQQEP